MVKRGNKNKDDSSPLSFENAWKCAGNIFLHRFSTEKEYVKEYETTTLYFINSVMHVNQRTSSSNFLYNTVKPLKTDIP